MTPASSWPKAAPAEAGFSPDIAERLDADLRSGQLDGLHAVLVLRDGRLVVER